MGERFHTLRVEKTIMEKFKVVAAENGRSVNKEIEMLMKAAVTDYEAKHGEIPIQVPCE